LSFASAACFFQLSSRSWALLLSFSALSASKSNCFCNSFFSFMSASILAFWAFAFAIAS
jgi:hypothetical protein